MAVTQSTEQLMPEQIQDPMQNPWQQSMRPPTQESTSAVVIQQPFPNMANGVPQNTRDWNSGLFDFYDDCVGCMCGLWCMCCLICSVARRMDESCFVPFFFCGATAMRTKIRAQFGIKGSICGDCCATTFCGLCVMCQLDRELSSVGLG